MSAQSQSEPFSSHGSSASTTRSMLSNKKKMAFLQTLLLLSLTLMQQRMLCSAAAGVETADRTTTTKQQQTSETLSQQQQQQQAANTNADPDDWTLTDDSFPDDNDNVATEFELERYQAPFSRPPQNRQQQGGEERPTLGILVVTTVDGTMAGLSKETGEILWMQPGRKHHRESSSSMKTSSSTREASEHDNDSPLEPLLSTTTTVGRSSEWRTAAVPSMDGKVYLTARSANHGSNGKDAHSEVAVTTTARELVQRAPFVDSRGRVYVGSRTTTVLAVDATTGHVQTVVEGRPNGNNMPPPGAKEQQQQDADNDETDQEHVIWMGRVSYTVSIQEPRSGDLDVQFTATELMSVHDLFLSSPQPNWRQDGHAGLLQQQQQQQKSNGNDQMGSSSTTSSLSFLVATPSGHVAYWDDTQGRIRWVAARRFDTPVAFCLDADSGDAVTVDLVPDAAMPDGSADYVSQEMQRQLELAAASMTSAVAHAPLEEQQTVVKSMPHSGQLFAMPLGRRSTTTSETAHHQLSPPPASSSHRQSAAAAVAQSKPSSRVPHIGGGSAGGRHYHFQDAGAAATAPRKHHCVPGSLHFPGCLTEFADLTQRGSNFLDDHDYQQQHAIVPSFHYGYLLPEQYQHNRKRSSYERLLKILGSWLAPTIALIFVVSFELGRRKRQTDVVPRIDSAEILADKTAPAKQQHEQQQDQQQQVGLIQVYDDVILGYGGHGTVVYKGMLEGRQVAVKRMLKAYHASADREISLLIESDGHANVVRYFLKEVRGDFVYLALELCDLSLHDMIGTLRSEWEQPEKQGTAPHAAVSRATKTVLFQIASGVRHLHHLRIVHRDLKPANILLADSLKFKSKRKDVDRSTYAKFMDGQYIAKISDMGLGKQLIGQSSYGASLINEASLRGHSNGGQSSIVGAGPGSVGWQAPEVMALRAPSDVSVRSEGSQGPTESLTDSSPNETASNTRTSRSVDIFSLGCIFYSTLMPGCHPFGEWYEREANIMHNKPNIKPLESISLDAYDLISAMLQRNPTARPTAKQICEHPFFWPAERRLAFLCDFSDRIETDATCAIGDDATSAFATKVLAIERNAAQVVGTSWDSVLDRELVSNVQRFRTYDPSSVRDLLRLIRNKHHHFDELPVSFKESIGSNTEGLLNYFEAKFPSLLIHCFCVCRELLPADDPLSQKYTITSVGRLGMKKLECSVSTIKEVNGGAPEHATLVEPETDEPTGQPVVSAPVVEAQEAKETSKSEGKDDTLDALPIVTDKDKETTATLFSTAVVEHSVVNENAQLHMSESVGPLVDENYLSKTDAGDIVVWHASAAAKTFHCRGWSRSDEEWERRTDVTLRKLDNTLVRCADDPKFRTRLCNHWDASMGTFCPMRKKGKCIFAHGPVELRVKEPKRHRWGKLVDQNGDNKNPNHSGGEDTYGAARSIESERKQEGKWNTGKPKGKKQTPAKKSPA